MSIDKRADYEFIRTSQIGGETDGITRESAINQGLMPHDRRVALGKTGLLSDKLAKLIDVPEELGLTEPSEATLAHWTEDTMYITDLHRKTWLCAIGEEEEVFAAVRAVSSSTAGNTYRLFEAASSVLSLYRQKQAIAGSSELGKNKVA